MPDDFKIGMFGRATFRIEKGKFKGGITANGNIKDMEGGYVLFVDNDDYPYLVNIKKDNFVFEIEEPNKKIKDEKLK